MHNTRSDKCGFFHMLQTFQSTHDQNQPRPAVRKTAEARRELKPIKKWKTQREANETEKPNRKIEEMQDSPGLTQGRGEQCHEKDEMKWNERILLKFIEPVLNQS